MLDQAKNIWGTNVRHLGDKRMTLGDKLTDSSWQQYQGGARVFAHMTLAIAMREFLYTKKNIPRGTLTSMDEIVDKYHSVSEWDNWHRERRNSYILPKTSESFQFLGGSLKKEADETLFLELALRGYDLSSLLRENTETDENPSETAEIVKIG